MRGTAFVVGFALCGVVGCAVEVDSGEPAVETVFGPPGGPDLIESAVSDPPASVSVGSTFMVTDTVENIGAVDAGASETRYFLSADGVTIAGSVRLGSRSVGPVMANNGTDSGSATATVPNIADGSYYVLACADRAGNMVVEVDENNNCLASTNTMAVSSPDLTETNVSMSPSTVTTGGTLNITETVNNVGSANAGGSTTRYFFSTDPARGPDDMFVRACAEGDPTPGRNVQVVAPGGSNTGTRTVPLCVRDAMGLHVVAPGTYYVIACADELKTVGESNETNNCGVSAGTFTVTDAGPDLVVTAVGNPPATANINQSFSVTETVRNSSTSSTAGASTTRYFLSLDTNKSGGDPALTGGRSVPSLAPLAENSGSTNVTVPGGTPGGTYYLLACADGNNAVMEGIENNNCRASTTTITIGGADLITSQLSNPPLTGSPGSSFQVIDRATNIGTASAIVTVTKYYLSQDGTNIVNLGFIGQRNVLGLSPGSSDIGAATVTIPSSIPAGTYFIRACADRTFVVNEQNENNNCLSSATTITIGGADLVETTVSITPTTVSQSGTIDVTETVANTGSATAPASVTRFYLSTDTVKSSNDSYMWSSSPSGPLPQRNVPSLAASASSTGTTTLVMYVADAMGHHVIAPGTYYIIACADQTQAVGETSETNNCTASATTFTVTP